MKIFPVRMLLPLLALVLTALPAGAGEVLQGRFVGPIRLKVWQHWQPSWNVERDPSLPERFELVRGTRDGAPFLRLTYLGGEAGLRARFTGRAFVRTGEYSDAEGDIRPLEVPGRRDDGHTVFEAAADDFVDAPGRRIVTRISFELMLGGTTVYRYDLLPMFVRGRGNHHWSTTIDPFTAHAGSGEIVVSNGASAETGLDRWNGVLVRPTLEFIDRNELREGSRIGLHRHEANQEMWLVESGTVRVSHGMAPIATDPYEVERQWDSSGATRRVPQFDAQGGWLEERDLIAGEYAVIVPNPEQRGNVCLHGLLATSHAATFTMGKKN